MSQGIGEFYILTYTGDYVKITHFFYTVYNLRQYGNKLQYIIVFF